jgi:hypothetical protein
MDVEEGFPKDDNDDLFGDAPFSKWIVVGLIVGSVIVGVGAALMFYVARSNWWYLKYLVPML